MVSAVASLPQEGSWFKSLTGLVPLCVELFSRVWVGSLSVVGFYPQTKNMLTRLIDHSKLHISVSLCMIGSLCMCELREGVYPMTAGLGSSPLRP